MECGARLHTELGPELRWPCRRARRVGFHLLHQGVPLRASRAHVAEAMHRRLICRRVGQSALSRAARVESMIHVGVRTKGGRRKLQRGVQGADVGWDRVEGTRVHHEHSCTPCRVHVPQKTPVYELRLAAQIDVVGLCVNARFDDRLAQEAVLGREWGRW